jgi:hypothetical protein
MANTNAVLHACLMDPSEGGDLEKVFNICDGDGDGFLTKEELEHILQDIGVEYEDIEEFMHGLGAEEFINFTMFTNAIDKFRSNPLGHSSIYLQSVNSNKGSPRSLAGSAAGGVSILAKANIYTYITGKKNHTSPHIYNNFICRTMWIAILQYMN